MVFEYVQQMDLPHYKTEKFIQELAWRDYWQQIWISKKDAINQDLKHPQPDVQNFEIPAAIVNATTGIEAIDTAILDFYKTGYLHNHVRMYIASLACNIGKSHWLVPAQWMYYHLLDADWASNALSWQWVSGANSNKKYYANQANINKYCHTQQFGTYLDISYSEFEDLPIPTSLMQQITPKLETRLPIHSPLQLKNELPTFIYNFYNLDPQWKKNIEANRILLLEPSHFKKYPVSSNTIEFVLALGENINGIQLFVGEFEDLLKTHSIQNMYFKEHPLNHHYQGIQEERDWMFSVKGYYPSFFAFWKKCQKEMQLPK
jgi:deoxyribodipyrimidine photo-lyase